MKIQDGICILIAAGGTGGHIFSALAFADRIKKRGHNAVLVTDHRFNNYRCETNSHIVEFLPIKSPSVGRVFFIVSLVCAYLKAFSIIKKLKPKVIVGFGGYPTLPTLIAAITMGLPIILHESNAVIGRVNSLLMPFAKWITISCPVNQSRHFEDKLIFTGNPVALNVKYKAYQAPKQEINLLIIGGSQGAAFFSKVIPSVLVKLPESIRCRLKVFHQCRIDDLYKVMDLYAAHQINAEVDIFFVDIISFMEKSHLIICRAGSGTITEIQAVGRPAIYIPYPYSRDDHQLENARYVVGRGAGLMIQEKDFNEDHMISLLRCLFEDCATLEQMAKNSKKEEDLLDASDALFNIAANLL